MTCIQLCIFLSAMLMLSYSQHDRIFFHDRLLPSWALRWRCNQKDGNRKWDIWAQRVILLIQRASSDYPLTFLHCTVHRPSLGPKLQTASKWGSTWTHWRGTRLIPSWGNRTCPSRNAWGRHRSDALIFPNASLLSWNQSQSCYCYCYCYGEADAHY